MTMRQLLHVRSLFIIIVLYFMQGCSTVPDPEDSSIVIDQFLKSSSYQSLKSSFLSLKTKLEDKSFKLKKGYDEQVLYKELGSVKTEKDLDKTLPKITSDSDIMKNFIVQTSRISEQIAKDYPALKKVPREELRMAIEKDMNGEVQVVGAMGIMKCDCSNDYARDSQVCLSNAITDATLAGFLLGLSGPSLGIGALGALAIVAVEYYQYTVCIDTALQSLGGCFDSCM